jgi:hypothetical protein
VVVFAVVSLVIVVALIGYLLIAKHQKDAAAQAAEVAEQGRTRLGIAEVQSVPHLVVRNTEEGPSYGKIALVPLSDPTGPRAIVDVSCDRVYATTSGAICLQEVTGLVTTYRTVFLDAHFKQTGTADLGGIPSRSRMSADGRYASSTVFISGHSYVDVQFATETIITDMSTQTGLGNLETWSTMDAGTPVTAADRNFWGVSFVGNGPGFYATMGTGGTRYLVHGDARTRSMEVVGENANCPSTSADGTKIVYKQQDPQSRNDHEVLMDLATGDITPLAEGRLVDDQVAWLDADTVLYPVGKGVASSVDFDIWSAPIDGGPASVFVPDAASPSVVVPAGS